MTSVNVCVLYIYDKKCSKKIREKLKQQNI